MALLLTDREVREAVDMSAMLDAVEEMHRRYAYGEAFNVDRQSVAIGESQMALMGGGVVWWTRRR